MINNDYEALVQALYLGITAPTLDKMYEVIEIADHIGLNFSEDVVDKAKQEAIDRVNNEYERPV